MRAFTEEKLCRAIDGISIQKKALELRIALMKSQIFELQSAVEKRQKRIAKLEAQILEKQEQLYQVRTKKIETCKG